MSGETKPKKVNILFRFKTLRTSILIPFLLLTVGTVLFFMFISVSRTRTMMLESATDYTHQLVDMANKDVDSYFSNLENIAQLIMNSADTRNYLAYEDGDRGTAEYLSCVRRLEQQFMTLRETRDDIYNIGIVGLNGRYLINNDEVQINPDARLEEKEWYRKALEGKDSGVYSHVQNVVKGEYTWVVTLSRSIRDTDTGEVIGVLFIDMNYSSITSLCEGIDLGTRGYVFVMGSDGGIIYHPKQQLLYSGLQQEETQHILTAQNGSFAAEDKQRIYTVSHSEVTGCSIVGVAYLSDLMQNSNRMQQIYMILAAVLIVVAAMVAAVLSQMISEPIRTLADSMASVEKGNFDVYIENPGYTNVIGDLIRAYNVMLSRISDLIEQIKAEQTEKRKSELAALQAQINPHFLYNTLDSIIWMAEGKKNAEVIQMTVSLSRLLRRSISNKDEFVRVCDEIGYVSEYLKIQKMRYHDKLDYDIDLAQEASQCYVPKLIIQPLVENAIYHGIKVKPEGGSIHILGRIEEDHLLIRVTDDGVGMDSETLHHIFDEKKEKTGSGVGVNNVNRRIKLCYGDAYGLWYESSPGKGTAVDVILPQTWSTPAKGEEWSDG